MHIFKKRQIEKVAKGAVRERMKFIAEIFEVAVRSIPFPGNFLSSISFCNTTQQSPFEIETELSKLI